ncbi:MAG TPA: hypothetical protein PKH58_10500 [Paludibacteraceae bacterium]|nr:hypothetical protein [Paludibacteraceae bacterium]
MQKVKVKLTGRHGHNIEGDIIECHPNLLPILEAQGKIASQEKEPEKEKEVKTKKTKK